MQPAIQTNTQNISKNEYQQLHHPNASYSIDQNISTSQFDQFGMLNSQIMPQYQHNSDIVKTTRSFISPVKLTKTGLQTLDTIKSIFVRQKSDVGSVCVVENQKFIYAANNNMELIDQSLFQCVEMSSCLSDCLIRSDIITFK